MKGRPKDPKRAQRRTGNRRKPDEAPAAAKLEVVPDLPTRGRSGRKPPPAPRDLPPPAQAMWDVIVAELLHQDLRETDFEAIRLLVMSAYRARQAAENIEQYGIIVMGERGGPIVNPLVKLERDSTMTYLRLAEQYGLTLASRLRLGLMQLAGQSVLSALNEDLDAGATTKR